MFTVMLYSPVIVGMTTGEHCNVWLKMKTMLTMSTCRPFNSSVIFHQSQLFVVQRRRIFCQFVKRNVHCSTVFIDDVSHPDKHHTTTGENSNRDANCSKYNDSCKIPHMREGGIQGHEVTVVGGATILSVS